MELFCACLLLRCSSVSLVSYPMAYNSTYNITIWQCLVVLYVAGRKTTSVSRRQSPFCARSSSTRRIALCTSSSASTTTTTAGCRRSSSDNSATKSRKRKRAGFSLIAAFELVHLTSCAITSIESVMFSQWFVSVLVCLSVCPCGHTV